MRKRLPVFVTFFLVLGVSLILWLVRPEAQAPVKAEDVDTPTPIQRGVMTEKQRKHSKLYEDKGLEPQDSETGSFAIWGNADIRMPGRVERTNQKDYLRALVCDADLVVDAKITSSSSQITDNLSRVFTDYELAVNDVVKNTSKTKVSKGSEITLTALGGGVSFDNRVIKYIVPRDVPLQKSTRYLLFLRFLRDSDSFQLISDRGIFSISQNYIKAANFKLQNDTDLLKIVESIRSLGTTCPS